MRRVDVCVDDIAIATALKISFVKTIGRELEDGTVRSEIFDEFHDTKNTVS